MDAFKNLFSQRPSQDAHTKLELAHLGSKVVSFKLRQFAAAMQAAATRALGNGKFSGHMVRTARLAAVRPPPYPQLAG
jgi:hypothetical protein